MQSGLFFRFTVRTDPISSNTPFGQVSIRRNPVVLGLPDENLDFEGNAGLPQASPPTSIATGLR